MVLFFSFIMIRCYNIYDHMKGGVWKKNETIRSLLNQSWV